MTSRFEAQAMRKRMLILRAELERMELAHHVEAVRDATTLPALLRGILPKMAVSKLPMLFQLFKRYPFLSSSLGSGVSLLVSRFKKPLLGRMAAYGGLALLIWQAWRMVQKIRSGSDTSPDIEE